MKEKIILDINNNLNKSNFLINLSGIDSLSKVHLTIDSIVNEGNKALENLEFEKVHDLLTLASRLGYYTNEEIKLLKCSLYGKKIVQIHKDKKLKDLNYSIYILLECKKSIGIINSTLSLKYNDEITSIINDIRKIEEETHNELCDLLKDQSTEVQNGKVSIGELKDLEEFIKVNKGQDINNMLELIKENKEQYLNNYIKTLNKDNLDEIRFILRAIYKEEFLIGEEFLNVISKIDFSKLENYNTLLEKTDKGYLLYNFNKAEVVSDKVKTLYSNYLPEFLSLPVIYKRYLVDKCVNNKLIRDIDEFLLLVNKTIDDIKNEISNKAIPV